MKIDIKEFEYMKQNFNLPVNKKKITDFPKYMYWHKKSEHFINKMNENTQDLTKYYANFNQALCCEFEKNKYCRINKKEFLILLIMLKYYNSHNENKLYMDSKGLKVAKHDRRAVRNVTN